VTVGDGADDAALDCRDISASAERGESSSSFLGEGWLLKYSLKSGAGRMKKEGRKEGRKGKMEKIETERERES
jgi:hypothetical protein